MKYNIKYEDIWNLFKVYNVLTLTRKNSLFFLCCDLVPLNMPKNNAKPWDNGGKGNIKKRTNGRPRQPIIMDRNKNNKLSKERFLINIWELD